MSGRWECQRRAAALPRSTIVLVLAVLALLAGACGTADDRAVESGATTSAASTTGTTGADPATTTTVDDGCAPSDAAPSTPSSPSSTAEPSPSTSTSAPPTSRSTSDPTTTSTTTPTSESTDTSTTTSTTASTTTPPSTTIDARLAEQQQRLSDLGYWLGPVDGRFGSLTGHAVTAFQKAEGLPRTGRLDEATTERLASAVTPTPRSGAGVVLEIDRARQILLVASGGRVDRIYDIATGAAATPTPAGQFTVYRQIDGYRHAPLGTLYRPKYFNGGIALHGYTSVPPQPASHGCVRLTYAAMDDLWASGRAPIGTAVWVY